MMAATFNIILVIEHAQIYKYTVFNHFLFNVKKMSYWNKYFNERIYRGGAFIYRALKRLRIDCLLNAI